jgi:hypothetical protein
VDPVEFIPDIVRILLFKWFRIQPWIHWPSRKDRKIKLSKIC